MRLLHRSRHRHERGEDTGLHGGTPGAAHLHPGLHHLEWNVDERTGKLAAHAYTSQRTRRRTRDEIDKRLQLGGEILLAELLHRLVGREVDALGGERGPQNGIDAAIEGPEPLYG